MTNSKCLTLTYLTRASYASLNGSDKETPTAQVRAYVLALRRHDDLLSIPFPSNSLYIQSTCGIVPNQ